MWYSTLLLLALAAPGPWVPFETGKGLIQLDVAANGKPGLKFLLDTGAGLTTIDEPVVAKLGLSKGSAVTAKGSGGNVAASLVTGLEIDLAGVKSKLTAVAIPLGGVATLAGMRMDGILGHNFLAEHTVEVDYAAKRLRLWDPGSYRSPAGASVVPIRMQANLPKAAATITLPDGRKLEASLKVDTGANIGLMLSEGYARRNHVSFDQAKATASTGGVGGLAKSVPIDVSSVGLGAYVATSPTARVVLRTGGGAFDVDDGVIGNDALGRGTLVIDYWARRLVLIPASRRAGVPR